MIRDGSGGGGGRIGGGGSAIIVGGWRQMIHGTTETEHRMDSMEIRNAAAERVIVNGQVDLL